MKLKCAKCLKVIPDDAFICPHCGSIIGDDVSYAAAAKRHHGRGNMFCRRKFWSVCVLLLCVLLSAGAYFLLRDKPQIDATQPIVTPPQTTPQTTAPLGVYTVQLRTGNKTDLTGAVIHVYLDDALIYSSQVGKDGIATFILPQSEGYYIRLTELPVQYQVHYDDAMFPFTPGQQELLVTLEEKPVPYTIRVVNSAGEPLAGTGLVFYSSGNEAQESVTDETGCCVFMAEYGVGTNGATLQFVPTGYYCNSTSYISFRKDSLEHEIRLLTHEEMGIPAEKVYTVRVVDEFGEPVPSMCLFIAGMKNATEGYYSMYGYTNLDGVFTFVGTEDVQHSVLFPNSVDYFEAVFEFAAGSRELEIQLELLKPPGTMYTYTVHFWDDHVSPIAGVQIAVPNPEYQGGYQYYTSDERGQISFESFEADPSKVIFHVTAVPDGYYLQHQKESISFHRFMRETYLILIEDGLVEYTVIVSDHEGNHVPNAEISIWMDSKCCARMRTDDLGTATFRKEAEFSYNNLCADYLPDPYRNYVIYHIESDGRVIRVTIAPPDWITPH